MTIETTDSKQPGYTGDDVTVDFAYPKLFFENSDLRIISRVIATGVETVGVLDTDYTVTGAGVAAGGTVTMVVAPPDTDELHISRIVPLTQPSDFVQGDTFSADVFERQLDRAVMMLQQLSESQGRNITMRETSSFSNVVLDDPVAGKSLVVNDDGISIGMTDTATDDIVSDAEAARDAALAAQAVCEAIQDALNANSQSVERFNGGTDTFVLANDAVAEEVVNVYLNGVYQQKNSFTYTSGTKTVLLDEAAAAGTDTVEISYGSALVVTSLSDNVVTTSKIADLAVTTAKLALLAVDTGQLAASAVETAKINNLAVTTAKIAALAVTSAKVAAGAITADKLASGVVSSVKLDTKNITTPQATVDFTTAIDGTYDLYAIYGVGIVAVTNGASFFLRVSTDGGSTWLNTNEYTYQVTELAGGVHDNDNSSGDSNMRLASTSFSNAANSEGLLAIFISKPSATTHSIVQGQVSTPNSTSAPSPNILSGSIKTTTALNGFQLRMNTGNISGKFSLHGIVL